MGGDKGQRGHSSIEGLSMDLRPWVGPGASTQLSNLALCAPSQAPDKVGPQLS